MNAKAFSTSSVWVLSAGLAAAVCGSRANATTLPLTVATPSYSYTTSGTPDSNASYTGGLQPDGAGYYSFSGSPTASISYTFDLAPNATNLNLTGASLFAPQFPNAGYQTGPTNGVSADYTVSGGNTGSGNFFSTLTDSFPAGTVNVVPFNENIPLIASSSDTFVTVTFTSTSTTTNNFQEQLLRSPQAFVATASFTPEPASIGLLGVAAVGILARRRRV